MMQGVTGICAPGDLCTLVLSSPSQTVTTFQAIDITEYSSLGVVLRFTPTLVGDDCRLSCKHRWVYKPAVLNLQLGIAVGALMCTRVCQLETYGRPGHVYTRTDGDLNTAGNLR
ncbi:uncharacterized protein LOC134197195 [Corticium candelabrum]|nr:uncharacterized protein LOC134181105 [Corticium candelabrum]XP_062522457.1 uncharacterized protein LOC134197195 [Corticium candelabrum]